MKKINLKSINFNNLGKNSVQDWFVIVLIFSFLFLILIVFSVINFISIKSFIKDGPVTSDGVDKQKIKSKEEELRDIINIYVEKEKSHTSIFKNSKAEIEKPVATTTASTTGSVASTTVPAGTAQ